VAINSIFTDYQSLQQLGHYEDKFITCNSFSIGLGAAEISVSYLPAIVAVSASHLVMLNNPMMGSAWTLITLPTTRCNILFLSGYIH